jgi:hypothetical protein
MQAITQMLLLLLLLLQALIQGSSQAHSLLPPQAEVLTQGQCQALTQHLGQPLTTCPQALTHAQTLVRVMQMEVVKEVFCVLYGLDSIFYKWI